MIYTYIGDHFRWVEIGHLIRHKAHHSKWVQSLLTHFTVFFFISNLTFILIRLFLNAMVVYKHKYFFIETTQGEWKRGFHSLPLLSPPPLQRDHLPQVLEQELQGHQPSAFLHHVRGQEQHSTRWNFPKKVNHCDFFSGVLSWEDGGSLDLGGMGLSRTDSRMSRVVMVRSGENQICSVRFFQICIPKFWDDLLLIIL